MPHQLAWKSWPTLHLIFHLHRGLDYLDKIGAGQAQLQNIPDRTEQSVHHRCLLPPLQVDQRVFGHLMQGGFPSVWAHFQKLEVSV